MSFETCGQSAAGRRTRAGWRVNRQVLSAGRNSWWCERAIAGAVPVAIRGRGGYRRKMPTVFGRVSEGSTLGDVRRERAIASNLRRDAGEPRFGPADNRARGVVSMARGGARAKARGRARDSGRLPRQGRATPCSHPRLDGPGAAASARGGARGHAFGARCQPAARRVGERPSAVRLAGGCEIAGASGARRRALAEIRGALAILSRAGARARRARVASRDEHAAAIDCRHLDAGCHDFARRSPGRSFTVRSRRAARSGARQAAVDDRSPEERPRPRALVKCGDTPMHSQGCAMPTAPAEGRRTAAGRARRAAGVSLQEPQLFHDVIHKRDLRGPRRAEAPTRECLFAGLRREFVSLANDICEVTCGHLSAQ